MSDLITHVFVFFWVIFIALGVIMDFVKAKRATKKIRLQKLFAIFCEVIIGAVVVWYLIDYWQGDTETVPATILPVFFVFGLIAVGNESCKWHEDEEAS